MTRKADAQTMTPVRPSVYRRIAAPAALFVLVAILYLPSIRYGFVYDDFALIVEQPVATSFGNVLSLFAEREVEDSLPYYRPLPRVTHVVQKYLHGDHPGPYHLFNVVLIGILALVAYYLFQSPVLQIPPLLALLGAALWAVHPIASNCVYPICSGRDTLLPVLFIMLAVYGYLRPGRVWNALALVMFALGLLCKELAIVTPALFVLADLCGLTGNGEKGSGLFCRNPGAPGPGASHKRVLTPFLLRYAPVTAILIGYLAIRLLLFAGEGSHRVAVFDSPSGPLLSVVYFFQTTMVPFVELVYEPRVSVWTSPWRYPVVLVAVGLLAVVIWRQWPSVGRRVLFWLGWIVVTLLPTANVLVQEAHFAERYGYLALLGLVGLAATAASAWPVGITARRVTGGVAVALVVVLATMSLHRGSCFKDNLSFVTQWVLSDPQSAHAHKTLGNHYLREKQPSEAISHYKHALQIKPDIFEAQHNWGVALVDLERFEEAVAHYQEALRIEPDFVAAHHNLGFALSVQGKFTEAIEHYQQALRIEPDFVAAHDDMGRVLSMQGKLTEAIEHFRKALQINPDFAASHYNWGNALQALGRPHEAVTHYQQALRIEPERAEAHNQLAVTLASLGQFTQALSHYNDALRHNPQDVRIVNNLTWLLATCPLAEVRDGTRALQLGSQLARLQGPDRFTFLATLAAAHAERGQFDQAVRWQEQAVQLAPDTQRDLLRGRLELYQQGKPFREEPQGRPYRELPVEEIAE